MRITSIALLAGVAGFFDSTVLANFNGVGQLPVMGWSGYNAFMQNSGHCDQAGAYGYNETTFLESMDAMVHSGLRDAGYVYVNADDCWIAENRTSDGKLAADPSRFPHGMAWLADCAHEQDLKLGLYAAASVETCRQFPGSQSYEKIDASTFASWGADFVKLDSCGGDLPNGTESWANQYGGWSRALNASGRPIVFSCSWAVYFTLCAAQYPEAEWESQCGTVPWENGLIRDDCHMFRYGMDLRPIWTDGSKPTPGAGGSGVADVIDFAASYWAAAWRSAGGVGSILDPDFLVVGCPTDRSCEPEAAKELHHTRLVNGNRTETDKPLSDVEQRTQFSMWCLLAAPLIIGSDIRNLSATALETLTNEAAIAINQDPLVAPPRLLQKAPGGTQAWARELANGDIALAVVNMGSSSVQVTDIQIDSFVCASCPRSVKAVDVWNVTAAPVVFNNVIAVEHLQAHETRLLRLTPHH
eukprot:INCI11891.1.p1 GENE.INCI11891.1~~INCI11891.1.p1  ORF type:complete len:471 (+),score=65.96 INCI11891.1:69-1481(+)